MRYILLVICCMFGLSASAQWYNVFKKHERFPLIEPATNHSVSFLSANTALKPAKVHNITLDRSEYSFQSAENLVMRTAQHNMRFRVYNDASYNFSDLARLYIQQNRYSEAKWYLLQSNIISRQRNDYKHTIANLIALATIKSDLGDFAQAQQDLTEAHDMAAGQGYKDDLTAIEKKMIYVKQNKNSTPKADVRYAEAPLSSVKGE